MAAGLGQKELAGKARISERTLSEVERRGVGTKETLHALARGLGCRFEDLHDARNVEPVDPDVARAYSRVFAAEALEPFVEIRVLGKTTPFVADLVAGIENGRHHLLFGSSGTGKSVAARRVAALMGAARWVPVLARARHYDGKLETLLDRAIGPYSKASYSGLAERVRDDRLGLLLVIDGWNECPQQHRQDLGDAIRALLRREAAVRLLVTSQKDDGLPADLNLVRVEIPAFSLEDREALLRQRGAAHLRAAAIAGIERPFDLVVAARVADDLPSDVTGYRLRHGFTWQRLRSFEDAPVITFLCRLAARMNHQMVLALDLPTAERLWPELPAGGRGGLNRLLDDGLFVREEHGRVVFAHEEWMRYFAAEAVLREAPDVHGLCKALEDPRNHHLADLVLQAQTDRASVATLLIESGAVSSLWPSVEEGQHGPLAQEVLTGALRAVFAKHVDAMSSLRATINKEHGIAKGVLDVPVEVSDQERRELTYLASVAASARWLPMLLEACDRVDQLVGHHAKRLAEEMDGPVEARANREASAARCLLSAMHHLGGFGHFPLRELLANPRGDDPDVPLIVSRLGGAATLGPGALRVLCKVAQVRFRGGKEEELRRCLTPHMPGILQAAWSHGWGLAKVEALCLVPWLAHGAAEAQRIETLRVLEALEPGRDMWVVQLYWEALEMLGADLHLDEPEEAVTAQIRGILANPQASEARTQAASFFSEQFEPLQAVSETRHAALMALPPLERSCFLAMAALGMASSGSVLHADLCLQDLIKGAITVGGTPGPLVAEALSRWATPPSLVGMPQDQIRCFLIAHRGLGQVGLPLSVPARPVDMRERAWLVFGELMYIAARANEGTQVEIPSLRQRAKELWRLLRTDLLEDSAGVFLQILASEHGVAPAIKLEDSLLRAAWPTEAVAHTLALLRRREALGEVLGAGNRITERLCEMGLDMALDYVQAHGGPEARDVLLLWAEDPRVGPRVAKTLRSMGSRNS